MFREQWEAMDNPPQGLDDPDYAAFAWQRYRRVLAWMGLVAVSAAAIAVGILEIWVGPLPIHVAIATALGVGCTILLAAALMGLVFLSSGTGHDEAVKRADLGQDAEIWQHDL